MGWKIDLFAILLSCWDHKTHFYRGRRTTVDGFYATGVNLGRLRRSILDPHNWEDSIVLRCVHVLNIYRTVKVLYKINSVSLKTFAKMF